jgi:ribosome biogenesis GTPase
VELIKIYDGLVADTPGFSAIEFSELEAEQLGTCFIEIRERSKHCKFRSCLHDKEPGCAVKNAVKEGSISQYRYAHYLTFLQEIISRKPRYSHD